MTTIYTLYVKTHKKTGLKYFGQTSKPNPHTYQGSGKDWVDHIKQYGYDVTTDIIFQGSDIKERNQWGRYYSRLWNIVNAQDDFGNKIWANRIPETGGGPGAPKGAVRGTCWNKGTAKPKILKGRATGDRNAAKRAEVRAKISAKLKGRDTPWLTGKKRGPMSKEQKAKLSAAKMGKPMPPRTPEHSAKIAAGQKEYWARKKAGIAPAL